MWAKPGRDAKTLEAFFELLGDRRHTIKAISIDMSAGYENAITAVAKADEQFRPQVVFDPFHVCQLASRAVVTSRRDEWNEHGKSKTPGGRWIKHSRWSLLKAPERQTDTQLARLAEVAATNKRLYRAFLLKEELRLLYHLPDPDRAPEHLAAWLAWASRSKLKPFVKLARTIRKHKDGILAAVRLGLSNAPARGTELEGTTHQPPQLRLPRTRTADQPHLPLRRRRSHRPTVHPQTVRRTPFPSASINRTPISFSASDRRAISARASASSGSTPPVLTRGFDAASASSAPCLATWRTRMIVVRSTPARSAACTVVYSPRNRPTQISYFSDGDRNRLRRRPPLLPSERPRLGHQRALSDRAGSLAK